MNWTLIFRLFVRAALSIKLKLIVLLAVVCVLLGVYLLIEKPSYKTSWVMLLPGTERSTTINLDNLGESRSSAGSAYGSVSISPKNTYKEIALSDAVINRAAEKYGVEAMAFSKPRISLIDQTPAMTFTLKGESKEELLYRANLYNNTFHETLDELRQNEIERNFEGVENNLAEAKARLNDARQEIVLYQSNSDVVTDEQFNRWLNDSEQFRTDQTNAQIKLKKLQATINATLEQLSISKDQARALLSLQSNPAIQSLLSLLSDRLAEQVSNGSQYGAQNPLRKAVDSEVKALTSKLQMSLAKQPELAGMQRAQLYGLVSRDSIPAIQSVNQLIAEHEGLQAQSAALTSSLQSYRQRIKTHAKAAATLADLQRDHQIAEAIFSSALAKLDTSRLDIYATYPLTQLLTQPGATIKRDRLQTKLMLVAGVLIYGLLALALVIMQVRRQMIEQQSFAVTNGTTVSNLVTTPAQN